MKEGIKMPQINSGDTTFMLISTALVCLMTPGLAFFYGGLVRKKNAITIMMQSFISMGIVTIIWILGGFSIAFGDDVGGVIGNLRYFGLHGVGLSPNASYAGTVPFLLFFAYQLMFAIITPALITGAFADRVNFKGYIKFLIIWVILVYAPLAHWVWGGGFLQKLGVVDFAGGIVVHTSAGMAALVSVIFVGKRKICKNEDTKPHNIGLVAIGTALLWFGWFGFNGGSALAANKIAVLAFVNTGIAGAVAMVVWMLIDWTKNEKPGIVGVLTGAVAGLATITPCAGYVDTWAAAIIGVLASVVCYGAVIIIKDKLGLDDALDVFGVHGVGGMLGSILVGLFANPDLNGVSGLFYGNVHQFLMQCLGTGIAAVYAYVVTFGILKVLNKSSVRVSEEVEIKGLDAELHGETVYDFH